MDTIEKKIGKRIRELRKKIGWSIEDLALMADVNRNYVCDLENGRRNPTIKVLEKIAKAFRITLSKLFEGIL